MQSICQAMSRWIQTAIDEAAPDAPDRRIYYDMWDFGREGKAGLVQACDEALRSESPSTWRELIAAIRELGLSKLDGGTLPVDPISSAVAALQGDAEMKKMASRVLTAHEAPLDEDKAQVRGALSLQKQAFGALFAKQPRSALPLFNQAAAAWRDARKG